MFLAGFFLKSRCCKFAVEVVHGLVFDGVVQACFLHVVDINAAVIFEIYVLQFWDTHNVELGLQRQGGKQGFVQEEPAVGRGVLSDGAHQRGRETRRANHRRGPRERAVNLGLEPGPMPPRLKIPRHMNEVVKFLAQQIARGVLGVEGGQGLDARHKYVFFQQPQVLKGLGLGREVVHGLVARARFL